MCVGGGHVCVCVHVSARPYMSVHVFTRVCVEEMSLINFTTLYFLIKLLHFSLLTDAPVLVFMENYVKK